MPCLDSQAIYQAILRALASGGEHVTRQVYQSVQQLKWGAGSIFVLSSRRY
jgi:hypothetical protein